VFHRACSSRIRPVLEQLRCPAVDAPWQLLRGQRTFLWDFPEWMELPESAAVKYVGPLWCRHWPVDHAEMPELQEASGPLALVAFGTTGVPVGAIEQLVRGLLHLGWTVVLAAGGQRNLLNILPGEKRLFRYEYAAIERILPWTQLVVCHGGQGIVFEAMRHAVPVIVVPFQPEQSHNGLCLERLGCGRRLFAPQPFWGLPVHIEEMNQLTPGTLDAALSRLLGDSRLPDRLDEMSRVIRGYDGCASLVQCLEERW